MDSEFKLELALSMKIEMVAPMEKIFKEESPIDKLFVIQRGLVGCRGRVLHEGDAFGDDVLIHYSTGHDLYGRETIGGAVQAQSNARLTHELQRRLVSNG